MRKILIFIILQLGLVSCTVGGNTTGGQPTTPTASPTVCPTITTDLQPAVTLESTRTGATAEEGTAPGGQPGATTPIPADATISLEQIATLDALFENANPTGPTSACPTLPSTLVPTVSPPTNPQEPLAATPDATNGEGVAPAGQLGATTSNPADATLSPEQAATHDALFENANPTGPTDP